MRVPSSCEAGRWPTANPSNCSSGPTKRSRPSPAATPRCSAPTAGSCRASSTRTAMSASGSVGERRTRRVCSRRPSPNATRVSCCSATPGRLSTPGPSISGRTCPGSSGPAGASPCPRATSAGCPSTSRTSRSCPTKWPVRPGPVTDGSNSSATRFPVYAAHMRTLYGTRASTGPSALLPTRPASRSTRAPGAARAHRRRDRIARARGSRSDRGVRCGELEGPRMARAPESRIGDVGGFRRVPGGSAQRPRGRASRSCGAPRPGGLGAPRAAVERVRGVTGCRFRPGSRVWQNGSLSSHPVTYRAAVTG